MAATAVDQKEARYGYLSQCQRTRATRSGSQGVSLARTYPDRLEWQSGEIEWVTEFARLPAKYGITNVYAEMGMSFANSCTTNPRFAAALLGSWIKGCGVDHVIWGTDSVFYGSPQWQIEALRRLEIPEDMQKKHGFTPLGPANGFVKN